MASNKANPAAGDRGARQEFTFVEPTNNGIADAKQLDPLRNAAVAAGARIAIGGVAKQVAVDRLYELAVLVGLVRLFGDDAVQAVLAEGIKAGQEVQQ
jgi:hypothetical protein